MSAEARLEAMAHLQAATHLEAAGSMMRFGLTERAADAAKHALLLAKGRGQHKACWFCCDVADVEPVR